MKRSMVGTAAILMLCVSRLGWASDGKLLSVIPASADALVWIDVAKITASSELKEALDSDLCKGIKMKLGAFTLFTGIDPMKDIEYFCFFARTGTKAEKSEVFAAQGRFDENRLTQLLALNDGYSTTTSGQLTIHQWHDSPDNARYGVFLPGGIIMVAETLDALSESIAPAAATGGVSRALALLPAEADSAIAWATFPHPEHITPLNANWDAFHAKGVNMILLPAGETLTAKANVYFDTDANASEGLQIAEGIVAVGRLQSSVEWLKSVAQNAKVKLGDRQNVQFETSAGTKETVGKLAEQVCRH